MKLSAAEDAIREGKPEVALGVLLEVWRDHRHPRLSELIERLSNQLTAAKGPLTAKTVGKLHEAALALHAKQDPAELGRLLQVRWPGTWQKGLPILQAILKWPEDPRIDAALAGLIAEPPYDSMASDTFFSQLRGRFERASDPRLIPTLEAAQTRTSPYWYSRLLRAEVDAAIKRLRAVMVELDDETSAALERIESYFAESKAREQDKSRGEAELLADIYARPKDLQARAVFADWLSERGDPRGELITLQLSSTRTRQQETRLNSLLKSHGNDWAGPLDEWFEQESRIFEAGFLTGGRFVVHLPRKLNDSLELPGWRLLQTLELRRWTPDITPLLDLAPLEHLHSLEEASFIQLALGPPRALTEVTVGPWVFDSQYPKEFNDELPGLPKLKTLGIKASRHVLEWMKRGPLFRRLQRLRISGGLVAEVLAYVRTELPNITEVEVLNSEPESWLEPGEWRLTFRRTQAGDFTELQGGWSAGRGFAIYGIKRLLGFADAKKITKLELSAARTLKLKAEASKDIEKELAKFTKASVTVPWERSAPSKPAKQVRSGPLFWMQLKGDTLLQDDMEPLWKQLSALGLQFDSYGVGYGGAHRSLGAKPAATLGKWGKNPRCHELRLYEDGTEEELWLERSRRVGHEAHARFRLRWADREVEPFLSWLEDFLDRSPFTEGSAWIGEGFSRALISDSGPSGGWLTIFGREQLRHLPEKPLEALLARYPGSFLRKTKHNLILGAGKSPLEPLKLDALGKELNELVVDEFTRVLGVDFLQVARDTLTGPANALGLEPISPKSEEDRGDRTVWFGKNKFTLRARFFNFLAEKTWADIGLLSADGPGGGHWRLELAKGELTAKTLPELLATACANLERDAPKWMVDPVNFKKKRR